MNNVVIVSGGEQRDSAIPIHVSILPKLPSHPGWHITLSRVPCLAPISECRAVCQSGLLQCFVMKQSKILCYQSKRQNDWELTLSSSSLCSEHSYVRLIEGVIFHRYFCKLL